MLFACETHRRDGSYIFGVIRRRPQLALICGDGKYYQHDCYGSHASYLYADSYSDVFWVERPSCHSSLWKGYIVHYL